jgi:ferric-dicitrate binding protein FerR (iron transport regulator)
MVRRAAAIVVAVGLGALAAREVGRGPSSDRLAAARDTVTRVVATRPGQQANVYLSDGTHVILGVASTLRFPTAFGRSRDVELDGEAFFEVAHEAARTFRVHTRYGLARDLGTKFDVRAYQNLPAATITVTEGSVVVTPNRRARHASARRGAGRLPAPLSPDSLIVVAAQVARASADGVLDVHADSAAGIRLAWMSGRLVFDQTPVGEAVDQLDRWYDADVELGDSTLAHLRLTASLGGEPFQRAIQVVARALDARVVRRDSTYILYPNTSGR